MSDLPLLVLAAGLGSRFGGLKQLAPVGPSGEALIDYSVYDAARAGFDRVVFIVSPENHERVKAHADGGCARHIAVDYAFQDTPPQRKKPWGTGQAVLVTRPLVEGRFALVNADDFYGPTSFSLLADDLRTGNDHTLIAFTLRDTLTPHGTVSRGLITVEDGKLQSVEELKEVKGNNGGVTSHQYEDLTGEEPVSTNLWGFQSSIFEDLQQGFDRFRRERAGDADAEYYIGDAVQDLVQRGEAAVRVIRTPDPWLGVTYQDDTPFVRRSLADMVHRGEYPERLWG